jgi:hypothetical protein
MYEKQQEPVELTLQQMVQRYREEKQKGDELVDAMFREELERVREQEERQQLLVEQVHRNFIEQGIPPLPAYEPPTVHYTELPAAHPDNQLSQEWNYYRREVGRLLAEGEEGRFVLIKGEKIIGVWNTQEEAEAVAFHKFPSESRLIHQVQRHERVLRGPSRLWRCLV